MQGDQEAIHDLNYLVWNNVHLVSSKPQMEPNTEGAYLFIVVQLCSSYLKARVPVCYSRTCLHKWQKSLPFSMTWPVIPLTEKSLLESAQVFLGTSLMERSWEGKHSVNLRGWKDHQFQPARAIQCETPSKTKQTHTNEHAHTDSTAFIIL